MDAPPTLIHDLRAVAAGDRAAWERLVQALAARLHAATYRILGDAHAADDATQDAFLALGRAAAAFRGEDDSAIERWAVAIACRTALMHARGRGRREQRVRTGLPAEVETMVADTGRDGADPARLDAAMRALGRLPEKHRLPITLHVFGSLDGAELARELGVSANAARVRLHRAFKKLEALLAAEGVTAAPSVICAELARTSPPLPGHDLLAKCRGLEWSSPPPTPHLVTAKGIVMASTAAAGLGLVAWVALANSGHAGDAPAPVPADPPRTVAPAPEPSAPTLSLQWQAQGPSNSFGATPPVVAGDAVLLSGANELRCVDRQTGAMRWSQAGKYQHSRPGVHGDEVIVMAPGGVESLALKDGSRRWAAELDGEANDASVVVHGDRALIATRAGTLWCLDLVHQGQVEWESANLFPQTAAWAPGLGSRGGLLLPLWNHGVTSFDEQSGKMSWTTEIPGLGAEPPVSRDGLVFALADDPATQKGTLVALDEASGAERWRKAVPQDRPAPPPSVTVNGGDGGGTVVRTEILPSQTIGAAAGPVITGDAVVIGSATDLLGYAADGTLRWRVPYAAFGYRTFTVDAQGRVWAGGDHGELLLVSAAGKELMRRQLDRDAEIASRPLSEAGADGKMVGSVGSVSNPAIDGDQYFLLTSGGVALCYTTKAQF
jgi:RNA polymerase sigma-70 factor (ECF subfamily)